ncbi:MULTISPECIES: phosphoribosylglycinamide formyltransferase [Methylobacterium]|uniref:Phosphoribosylglycinamide formyltransferase n=1 Tax=Methylobacterium longum TaxID=767694 RepID=A0ABT8AL91_9HYPH|nr:MULTISPECIES: phosphoribosylglycinamide formyltransferase [Methylobacterium]MCJ2101737.1 phosphoribosylglycinamide formyltransferase [Methylobacterium sp. E-046]MDN3570558.1 phosphoribosylglycinamide formyltransferase [Methylobacterium longum]GJE09702.1 Phosphoribosylglycinamide formyltransferase [Methylobacterium longum]
MATVRSRRTRVAVLISGRGSNMVALLEAARDPAYPAEIVLVVSNRPEAAGLARAAASGIPTRTIDHKAFADRAAFDAALDAALRGADVDLVCLAGFMRILTPDFVASWAGRMLNIHPSLLPLFKGTHTHRQALEAGVRLHGCTVHFVVPELDAGPIVAQAAIPVRQGDDPDSLADRVIVQERRLYPEVLALVAGGRARLEGDRVEIADAAPDGVLFSL